MLRLARVVSTLRLARVVSTLRLVRVVSEPKSARALSPVSTLRRRPRWASWARSKNIKKFIDCKKRVDRKSEELCRLGFAIDFARDNIAVDAAKTPLVAAPWRRAQAGRR